MMPMKIDASAQIASNRQRGGFKTHGKPPEAKAVQGPLVTLITAVLNGSASLERTILSVLNQTYTNIEYIVIDGGSTDDTIDILRKYDDRISYWVSEPDKGIYDAMNKGIALSNGELVGLINSDDVYENNAVECVVDAYQQCADKSGTIVYGNYYVLDEAIHVKTELISDLRVWRGMSICHQAMFVSRDIYQNGLVYDSSLKYAADYAFLLGAIASGVRFINTGRFLVTFSNRGATYTNVWSSYKESLSVLRRSAGILNKLFIKFFFFQFLRSVFVTAIRICLDRIAGKNTLVRAKMVYNRIFRRSSSKV